MDRKEYWNKEYTEYWKKITNEAEETTSVISHIQKISGNDYKVPNIGGVTSFFEKIPYQITDKLLDYGCGFGRFFTWFSGKCDYYGIDISKAMIDECISRYPESSDRFIVAEGEKLPFEDHFFDTVVCYGVFDACYQEDALFEILRVLKNDGYLLISGKNTNYFEDDEEAVIAERNARKKGHPNYFTDVEELLKQISELVEIKEQWYAERRGDFTKDMVVYQMPSKFYEWMFILKKIKDRSERFSSFSCAYSNTWKQKYDDKTM